MPQSGLIIDIQCRVLLHQAERYQLSLTCNVFPHGDKGRALVLIFHNTFIKY